MARDLTLNARPRTDWGGSPTSPAAYAPLERGIVVHWNGPGMGAYSRAQVAGIVAGTWDYHVKQNGWADIAYNYSVDRYGEIWTGRGDRKWNAASGTTDANTNYLAVECLCGVGDVFTGEMMQAIDRIAAAYVASGRTPKAYRHRDVTATACPGDEIAAYVAALSDRMASAAPDLGIASAPSIPKAMAGAGAPTLPEAEYLPDYLVQATDNTMYAVYSNGRVRQLIFPELQYFEGLFAKAKNDLTVVRTTNKDNDAIMHNRSLLG